MRCRQVTRMISESHERSLDIQEKVGLKVHLVMCSRCRRFQQNCETLMLEGSSASGRICKIFYNFNRLLLKILYFTFSNNEIIFLSVSSSFSFCSNNSSL